MVVPPVDPLTLRSLWGEGGAQPLAAAVSGGGDSLALLALLREAAPTRPLIAIIVDHAIQPGSEEVAARAAERAAALGARVVQRRLFWEGEAARDQASARRGRYRAIAEAAKEAGAGLVAVAHTLDDQAETALIKYGRSGRWGEAGMRPLSPCPVWPEGLGVGLARPLLGVRRAHLRAWAKARGLAWHEDPANANPAYARVRARRILEADPELRDRLGAHATRAAETIERRNAAALAWVLDEADFDDAGRVRLKRLPQDRAGRRGFAVLLGAVAGDPEAVAPDGVARLVEGLRAGVRAHTLGGAVVRRRKDGFVVDRDPGALLGRSGVAPPSPLPLTPGAPIIVDGRLLLRTDTDGYTAAVTPEATWALRRNGHWIALNAADDVAVEWLAEAQARHVLGPWAPFAACDACKGVQPALGSLS